MSQTLPRLTAASSIAAKAFKPALMAAGLVAVAATLPLLGHGAAQAELNTLLSTGGLRGQGMFLLLSLLLVAFGLPRQIPAFAAGLAYGPLYGAVLALAAQVGACALDFIWARAVGQEFCRKRFGARLAWLDRTLAHSPFLTVLSLRLMPVGNNLLLNLAAGLTTVRLLPFVAASAVGFIPQTLVFALLGQGSLPSHGPALWVGGIMFVLAAGLGIAVWRRARPEA
jgi:uncharacterized membrane protein YdjX (TVP38/TMEM64 family)